MSPADAPAHPAHPGVRVPPPLLYLAGFVAGWLLHRARPLPLGGASLAGTRVTLGWLLIALGLVLMFAGAITFRLAHTAVVPIRPASRLVVTGPYRFTRNPMYLGFALVYVGGSLLLNDLWPILLLPLVLVVLVRAVIRREERYLSGAFGADYEGYRRRVRRWL